MRVRNVVAIAVPVLLLAAVQVRFAFNHLDPLRHNATIPLNDTAVDPPGSERTSLIAARGGVLLAASLLPGAQIGAGDILYRIGRDEVKAKTDAEVAAMPAKPGASVSQGDTIMVLRTRKIPAASAQALGPVMPGTWTPDLLATGEYVPDTSYAGYRFGEVALPAHKDASVVEAAGFGAVPDDGKDDTAALRTALAEARRRPGRVIVQLPAGRLDLSDILFIERSDLVLRGAGSGSKGTLLHVSRPLAEMPKPEEIQKVEADIARRNWRTNHGGLYSAFAWNGGVIWTRNPHKPPLTPIAKALEGARGAHTLRLGNDAAGAGVKPGEIISIRWYNRGGDDSPMLRHMYGIKQTSFGEKQSSQPNTAVATQEATVIAVNGNEIQIKQPLLFDVRPDWNTIVTRTAMLENVGIERMHIRFVAAPQAPHEEERGHNGLYLTDLAHSWVRDIRIENSDSGILVNDSTNLTIEAIQVDGRPGHYGVVLLDVYNVLVRNFDIRAAQIHSISFDARARASVYTNGLVRRATFELHRGPAHANLFDNIVSLEDRVKPAIFSQTGQPYWGPAGGYNTYWNMQIEMTTRPTAPVELGPLPDAGLTRVVGVSANVPVKLTAPGAHVEHIGSGDPAIPSLYAWQLAARTRAREPMAPVVRVFSELKRMNAETRWTVWGNGLVARDGKYYFAVGNHQVVDGNTMVMAYDPDTRTVNKVFDVSSVINQKPGQKGHGKIHADIVEDAQGWLYFTTWWGGRDPDHEEPVYDSHYQGSIVLRYHPGTARVENLGAIVPQHGLVSDVIDAQRGLIYFRAISYRKGKDEAGLAVYDIARQQLIFTGGGAEMGERRGLMLGANGRLYFSGTDLKLRAYDPLLNKIVATQTRVPAVRFQTSFERKNMLRVGTVPGPDGAVYGTTHGGMIFGIDPAGATREVGPTWKEGYYAPSLALSPDGRSLFYAPYLPGPAGQPELREVPVMRYDVLSGQRQVLALLGPLLAKQNGYVVGQNYGVALDPGRSMLYLIHNGHVAASDDEVPCFVAMPLSTGV